MMTTTSTQSITKTKMGVAIGFLAVAAFAAASMSLPVSGLGKNQNAKIMQLDAAGVPFGSAVTDWSVSNRGIYKKKTGKLFSFTKYIVAQGSEIQFTITAKDKENDPMNFASAVYIYPTTSTESVTADTPPHWPSLVELAKNAEWVGSPSGVVEVGFDIPVGSIIDLAVFVKDNNGKSGAWGDDDMSILRFEVAAGAGGIPQAEEGEEEEEPVSPAVQPIIKQMSVQVGSSTPVITTQSKAQSNLADAFAVYDTFTPGMNTVITLTVEGADVNTQYGYFVSYTALYGLFDENPALKSQVVDTAEWTSSPVYSFLPQGSSFIIYAFVKNGDAVYPVFPNAQIDDATYLKLEKKQASQQGSASSTP